MYRLLEYDRDRILDTNKNIGQDLIKQFNSETDYTKCSGITKELNKKIIVL